MCHLHVVILFLFEAVDQLGDGFLAEWEVAASGGVDQTVVEGVAGGMQVFLELASVLAVYLLRHHLPYQSFLAEHFLPLGSCLPLLFHLFEELLSERVFAERHGFLQKVDAFVQLPDLCLAAQFLCL